MVESETSAGFFGFLIKLARGGKSDGKTVLGISESGGGRGGLGRGGGSRSTGRNGGSGE